MIILASGSPRRKEILNAHGITPEIIKPEVAESIPSGFSESLTVEQTVMFLSLKKGLHVQNLINNSSFQNPIPNTYEYIISADTVVYDGNIIGKPNNKDDAVQILLSLRNKAHKVLTGVTIVNCNTGSAQILCDTSTVFFKDYNLNDIEEYIDKESPYDKAGSYAIQSSWKKHVAKIDGDLENVIGLPWYRIQPIII